MAQWPNPDWALARRGQLCQPEGVPNERQIHKSVIVPAPIEDVWAAWTTDAGIRSWLVEDSRIELQVGGRYEWYFYSRDEAPPGLRGSEGCQVIGYQAPTMLTFTWSAPPRLSVARAQRTVCLLRLREAGHDQTQVELTELGWGDGGEWDIAHDYFDVAWGRVLNELVSHFQRLDIQESEPVGRHPAPPPESGGGAGRSATTDPSHRPAWRPPQPRHPSAQPVPTR